MSADSKTGTKRGRLIGLLRIVAGLAILLIVAATLPWRDRLVWHDADGGTEMVRGEIEGNWTGEGIEFRPDAEEELAGMGPAALDEEAFVAVTRRDDDPEAADASGYEWKPGLPRVFRGVRLSGLLQAFGLVAVAMCFVITRWWRLLAVAGCRTSWFGALRLTLLGYFFNLVVPGLTGGDVVKAVIAAKENPGRRPDALVSVAADRILGLIALAGLATVVILLSGDTFAVLRTPLLVFMGGGLLALFLYANPTLRRLLRLDRLFDKLPLGDQLRALDRAAVLYLHRPFEMLLALGLSLANHFLVIFALFALGNAFGGIDARGTGLREYFVVTPVANIVSALPLAPGGWGLGEAAYKELFELVGGSGTIGVAVSVSFRLILLGFGLLGGIFLLLPGAKAEVAEAERTVEADQEGAGAV